MVSRLQNEKKQKEEREKAKRLQVGRPVGSASSGAAACTERSLNKRARTCCLALLAVRRGGARGGAGRGGRESAACRHRVAAVQQSPACRLQKGMPLLTCISPLALPLPDGAALALAPCHTFPPATFTSLHLHPAGHAVQAGSCLRPRPATQPGRGGDRGQGDPAGRGGGTAARRGARGRGGAAAGCCRGCRGGDRGRHRTACRRKYTGGRQCCRQRRQQSDASGSGCGSAGTAGWRARQPACRRSRAVCSGLVGSLPKLSIWTLRHQPYHYACVL